MIPKARSRWIAVGLVTLLAATTLAANPVDNFKLAKAVPADTMLVVHARNHEGMAFVNEQMERVWKAVERQHFERILEKLLKDMAQGQDDEQFEQWWQQVRDLASGVEWSLLAEREFAFAMKLGMPTGSEWVALMMPPADRVGDNFDALAAILRNVAELSPEQLELTSDGAGQNVVHRLFMANAPVPLGVSLARHDDVIMVAFGTSMVEQSLALLRGDLDPSAAALMSTPRFKDALSGLPAAKDSVAFVDVARMMPMMRTFAQVLAAQGGAAMDSGDSPESQPATPENPLEALLPLIDAIDVWDYVAAVQSTEGKESTKHQVVVLRDGAPQKALYRILYANDPITDPLKYVPASATTVSVTSGIDMQALYDETVKFIGQHIPDGEMMLEMWEQNRATMPIDPERDILAWMDGRFTSFTVPGRTAYSQPQWLWMLDVKDEEQAQASLERIYALMTEQLAEQGGGVEDATIEGAEGFKQIIVPMPMGMLIGRPAVGVHEGKLWIANGPEVVELAMKTGAGDEPGFKGSARFKEEGLPLPDKLVGFGFSDLSSLGEDLGTQLQLLSFGLNAAGIAKQPGGQTLVMLLAKVGNVVRELNFFRSSCTVTSFDGRVSHAKTVVHYQEPPQPKKPGAAPAEEPPADDAETSSE
jgi:predicted RNA-binding protein YlxR (DUF448 family)